ncbi:DUF6345 domain-containing protein [Sorangium sp. So ce131]|uniref:DUF6345 domain-containing protein n=1 Tax=Sorangium sp. So ce131 TaxID=3133282 RepID=UPI003F62E77E
MRTARLALLLLPAAVLGAHPAHAGYFTHGPSDAADHDGWTWEVYADAVDDHPGTGSDLANCAEGVRRWTGRMAGAGYSYRYSTNWEAWSSDFEEASYDDIYGDASDYAYISTHGSSDATYFNGSYGDNLLTSSETYWGELDMDAMAFDACQVLDANGRYNYGTNSLNDGVHFVFGFESLALDTATTADMYGYYMTQGYTLRSAWILATSDGHPATYTDAGITYNYTGSYVRFYNSSCDTYNDTMNSVACDPTWSSWWNWATWTL